MYTIYKHEKLSVDNFIFFKFSVLVDANLNKVLVPVLAFMRFGFFFLKVWSDIILARDFKKSLILT